MTNIVTINNRGTLTLPKRMRRALRISGKAQLVAEEAEGGILLRPSATFPVELYTSERLDEFKRINEDGLAEFRFASKKKKKR